MPPGMIRWPEKARSESEGQREKHREKKLPGAGDLRSVRP